MYQTHFVVVGEQEVLQKQLYIQTFSEDDIKVTIKGLSVV